MIKRKFLISIIFLINTFIFNSISYAENVFEIKANEIKYKENKKLIIAEGDAQATDNLNKKIFADKIYYYKDKNLIETFGNSKYTDTQNIIEADSFKYNTELKIIEARKNVVLIDIEKNKFFFNYFKYLENDQVGYGNIIKSKLSDGSYIEAKKGKIDNKNKVITLDEPKYTTCSKVNNSKDEFCPTWSLKSSKIINDRKSKKIIHKNARLKIKNIPIFFSPYVSHPDPSVKRQSGFLPPSIKTLSNIGKTLSTPYYWVISKDKDMVIKPVFYFDEHQAIQTSYRQAFKNGMLKVENGYTKGYKRFGDTNRTKGSRNYFFANFEGNYNNILFKENEIKFNIQRISQENYVKVNKINTSLFKEDINTLENSFQISSYEDNKKLDLKIGVFENLNSNDNTKYTYYFPDGIFSYNFNQYKKMSANFNSYFQGKKFDDGQRQGKVRNLISINSNNIISKKLGVNTIFKSNLYNNNIYNTNVANEKDNLNINNYLTLGMENSFPLAKFTKNGYHSLTPKIFTKYTTGKMKDTSGSDKVLFYSDIYSINRTNNLDKPETGISSGYGIDYTINNYDPVSGENYFQGSAGIGQVLNQKYQKNMSTISSLNNKSSDFVGFFKFNLLGEEKAKENKEEIEFLKLFEKNNFEIDYNYNLNSDLKKISRNNINLSGTYDNFYSKISYNEENMHIGNQRYTDILIKKKISDNYFFSFNGKKNLKSNSSEYYNFSINFENDCLTSYLSLSKDFYYDKDITSTKTLIFGVTFKPFSDSFGPDLTDIIN